MAKIVSVLQRAARYRQLAQEIREVVGSDEDSNLRTCLAIAAAYERLAQHIEAYDHLSPIQGPIRSAVWRRSLLSGT
jgi:hypothetical protein